MFAFYTIKIQICNWLYFGHKSSGKQWKVSKKLLIGESNHDASIMFRIKSLDFVSAPPC